jgi:putative component of toxin-antitoxin plasmid stabilization module
MIEVEEFLREDGTSPFQNWFMKLDAQAASKITTALLRLELETPPP